MGLKKWDPSFAFSGNQVTADEIDANYQYTVYNPSIDASWFGTCVGTQTQNIAVGAINKFADYPRNLKIICRGAAGSVVGGTITINGKDQFGNAITETFLGTSAIAGGTTIGTKVFSQVSSGTCAFGTGDAGNGTCQVGVGTAGTTTLFGLPYKFGGSTDIKNIGLSAAGTQTSGTFVFGGTPSSAANVAMSAFKAPADVPAGTCIYNVTVDPTGVTSTDVNLFSL